MEISKLKSPFVIRNLFSFISERRKFKIIKYNTFLNKKLEFSIENYKEFFFKNRVNKYNYKHIYNFWVQFQNDFKNVFGTEKDFHNLFLNALAKKQDFNLKLIDDNFNIIFENVLFKQNLRIELETMTKDILSLTKILLIKNDKFTDKALRTFKHIFDFFSVKEKMSKTQLIEYINTINEKKDDEDESNKLFSFFDNNEYLYFDDFSKFYFNSCKSNLSFVWRNLHKLGYNDLLDDKGKYDLDYIQSHLDEYENLEIKIFNFFRIINENIFKLCICSDIDKIFIDYLNQKKIFANLKEIEITISNLEKFVESNIVCYHVETLKLLILKFHSEDDLYFSSYNESNNTLKEYFNYNKKEIFNIFPNIITFQLYFKINLDLVDLIRNLENSKIKNLDLIYECNYLFPNSNIESKIILKNIENLSINGNKILFHNFNNIIIPNLVNYKITLDLKEILQDINDISQIIKLNENDFSIINNMIIEILKNKKQFVLNKFIYLIQLLKKIKILKINLGIFSFIYKKDYFEFKLENENEFKNYYKSYDFSIDEKEILKYKKFQLKGISKLKNIKDNKIEEIIEDETINFCDINLCLSQKIYYIKSLKNIRSIYCEEEIQKTNLMNILPIQNIISTFNKLKYLNLTIGYIKESPNDNNSPENHIYSYLSNLIKKSENLKSLILRLHPNNYSENISFFLSLIQNLKKLKIIKINIIENSEQQNYYFNEELLNQYPKIKERKYCYKIFQIMNKSNYFECVYYNKKDLEKQTQLFNNVEQDYKDTSYFYKEGIKDYLIILLDNQQINFSENYEFDKEEGKILIKSNKLLTNLNIMFYECFFLTSLISNFITNNVIDMNSMFYNCSSLTDINLLNFDTKNVIDMSWMFSGCSSLKHLNLSNFNTENVTNMNSMFYNCSNLISLDISNFCTNQVKFMNSMFYNCSSLTSLNISHFNTNNVIDMFSMFCNCSSLTSINVSNFNTEKVTDMFSMFKKCSSFSSLNLSNFNTSNVIDMKCMFSNCSNVKTLNLSNFNTNKVKDFDNIFFGLNKKCEVITSDEKLIEELKNL